MARPLSNRLGGSDDDSVRKFELSAAQRFKDAETLRRSKRSLGSIYLYGYSAEMWIKAAYFRAYFLSGGLGPVTPIRHAHRQAAAKTRAKTLLNREVGPHEIAGWAELLVADRATSGTPYPLAFGNEIVNRASILHLNWREYMRYRSVRVRPSEINSVRSEADWFRHNYASM